MVELYEKWHQALKASLNNPDKIYAIKPNKEVDNIFFKGLVNYLNENSDYISAYIGSDKKINFMIKINHEEKYKSLYEEIITKFDGNDDICVGYPEEQSDIFEGFSKWLNKNYPNIESKIEYGVLLIKRKKNDGYVC